MPMINADDGCALNVEVSGREGTPVLMLSNSLGTDLTMWDDQAGELAKHFRLIRYDRRGHGKSGTTPGPYSFDRFGRDILAIIDALGVKTMNWCGLSMGGMDGQWLGANAPTRVDKLILSNTHYYYPDKAFWSGRIKSVQDKGLEPMVDANMQRWFTQGFRERAPEAMARMTSMFLATDKAGYTACCEAIATMDFRTSNPTIKTPTLVIVGAQDAATPPEAGETIAQQIPGAKVASVDAAHIANVEQPQAYTKTVLDFLLG
jgi:3-oxoadipate enol-lactonase